MLSEDAISQEGGITKKSAVREWASSGLVGGVSVFQVKVLGFVNAQNAKWFQDATRFLT